MQSHRIEDSTLVERVEVLVDEHEEIHVEHREFLNVTLATDGRRQIDVITAQTGERPDATPFTDSYIADESGLLRGERGFCHLR